MTRADHPSELKSFYPTAVSLVLQAGIYIVATPLGNLQDITIRALDVLAQVDLILCEDTRTSRVLLARYGIKTPLQAFHEHNEDQWILRLMPRLHQGQRIALISDAGTPLISDPGYKLVQAAIAENISLTSLPGPVALINALVLSGLPSYSFVFGGFLPPKSGARLKKLEQFMQIPLTLIFYESPQRILETLQDIETQFIDRLVVVVREMTKKFEEVLRGSAAQLIESFKSQAPRGEMVLLIAPSDISKWTEQELDRALTQAMTSLSLKQAVEEVSKLSGHSKKQLYQQALKLREAK